MEITPQQLRNKSLNDNLETEFLRELKEEHEKLYPKLTNEQWLEIFPEAKADYILPKIAELKIEKEEMEKTIKRKLEIIKEKSVPENQWFWEDVVTFFDTRGLWEIKEWIKKLEYLSRTLDAKPVANKGKITKEKIIKAESIPIESVVGRYVKLKMATKNLIGLCPFHAEKSPSFYIYPATNSFYCFGCQKGGNTINFLMEYLSLKFKEAVNALTN